MQMPWEIAEAASRKKGRHDPNQPVRGEDSRYPATHGKGRNKRSKRERELRQNIFNAQNGLCHWCKEPMQLNPMRRTPKGNLKDNPAYASFEHLTPKSKGGARSKRSTNIVLAHASCNNSRPKRRFPHDPIYGRSSTTNLRRDTRAPQAASGK